MYLEVSRASSNRFTRRRQRSLNIHSIHSNYRLPYTMRLPLDKLKTQMILYVLNSYVHLYCMYVRVYIILCTLV